MWHPRPQGLLRGREKALETRMVMWQLTKDRFHIKQIRTLYKDVGFDLKNVIFENFSRSDSNVRASLCGTFGPKMNKTFYVDDAFAKEIEDGILVQLPVNKKTYAIEIRGEKFSCYRLMFCFSVIVFRQ